MFVPAGLKVWSLIEIVQTLTSTYCLYVATCCVFPSTYHESKDIQKHQSVKQLEENCYFCICPQMWAARCETYQWDHLLSVKCEHVSKLYLRTPPRTLRPIFSVIISSIRSNRPSILWWINSLMAGFKTSPFATTLSKEHANRTLTQLPLSLGSVKT